MPNRRPLPWQLREAPPRRVLRPPTDFDPFTSPSKVRVSRIRATTTTDANGRGVLTILIPGRGLHPVRLERLIAAIDPQTGQALIDSFTRTIGGGGTSNWGTPDLGPAYVVLTDKTSGAGFNVTGTEGQAQGVAQVTPMHIASPISRENVVFSGQWTAFNAAVAGNHFRLTARVKSATTYYALEGITNAVPQIATVNLVKRVAGVETIMATAAVGPLAFPVSCEFILAGTSLEGRVWVGAAKPAAATVSTSDADITGTGSAGFAAQTEANISRLFNVDNFSVVGSQNVPSWFAYLNDPTFLTNIVEASPEPVNLWVPQIVNGQQFFPGDVLQIVGTGAPPSIQMISTGHVLL